ncbi:hypothetical protein HJG60_002186 [Phyllostomus discolor]|uniref:Protein KASH5 n=1 Tax=Phyllostomus discolor TaxID=89673 RepID=A0A833YJP0_9CHIR|nr:hypothetical protein HJG60_002186 [Phyllostomus discolor]
MSEWNTRGEEEAGGEPESRAPPASSPTVGRVATPAWAHLQAVGRHTGLPPPACVARPPKGMQARREDWAKLLPPSLGMEIRALWQQQEEAAADLSSPLCGVWQWQEGIGESDEEAEGQRNFQGEPAYCQEGKKGQSMWLPRREEEEEAETRAMADLSNPLRDPHPPHFPRSPPESSPAPPDLRQALVPVEKKLVPVRRQVWGQLCLCPLHPQRLRVARHPLIPAPVLALLLLLLLLSLLLLGQSPPPTWPHLQLCYLRPPPV